jgi:hypothetical protein
VTLSLWVIALGAAGCALFGVAAGFVLVAALLAPFWSRPL